MNIMIHDLERYELAFINNTEKNRKSEMEAKLPRFVFWSKQRQRMSNSTGRAVKP